MSVHKGPANRQAMKPSGVLFGDILLRRLKGGLEERVLLIIDLLSNLPTIKPAVSTPQQFKHKNTPVVMPRSCMMMFME